VFSKKLISKISTFLTAAIVLPLATMAGHAKFTQSREKECLAQNVYHEGRGESVNAQKLIALITVNRTLAQSEWGNTVCKTVWQPKQFSWTQWAGGGKPIRDAKAWTVATQVAEEVYTGKVALPAKMKCAHYYKRTDNVGVSANSKVFFATLRPIAKFDSHTAYSNKGCR
jgi:spore germination cell wall hydrolase CwlJ-like protein